MMMITGPDGNDRPVRPDAIDITRRALAMSEAECCTILTLVDEPELILQPGETVPTFDPRDVAAARLRSAWIGADVFTLN